MQVDQQVLEEREDERIVEGGRGQLDDPGRGADRNDQLEQQFEAPAQPLGVGP